jgi:protein involved in polysaccharide export with SLBB domain
MNFNKLLLFFPLLVFFCMVEAQQLPADLSKVKASQLTDSQLSQLLQRAKANGQTKEDIIEDLKQRGLPESELILLSERANKLIGNEEVEPEGDRLSAPAPSKGNRISMAKMPEMTPVSRKVPRVFGAELFMGASPLFTPNLSIATPANYTLGPGDELLLEVYGANVFNQKLLVSREGYINVKYVGLIAVNGLTIQDLVQRVKTKLSTFIPALSSGASRLQLSLTSIRSITITVVGAVKKPGTLTIPSLATLFNALYATGGPLENGSLRNIELIRGNKKILVADLYDFLMKGDQSANVFLQDNDLIRVPFAQLQVQLSGLINREGIFEAKPAEHLSDLFMFAGGFKPLAYQGRVTGTRGGVLKKEVIDVALADFDRFLLRHGDSLHVDSLVEKYSNRVIIRGAVYKPGVYSWTPGQQLTDLIEKAAGLKADAYLGRANILRTNENLFKENLSINLQQLINGKISFQLQNEDSITIFSAYELKDKQTVSILGAIRNPGQFSFSDSLTLQQLILMAGGFTEKAIPTGIEIGRNRTDDSLFNNGEARVDLIKLAIKSDLDKVGADVYLRPDDIVSIKSDPNKIPQSKVSLIGKVLYPGTYVLESREDRLSGIIKRAGGLLSQADINGVKVIRRSLSQDTTVIKKTLEKQVKNKFDTAGTTSKDDELLVTEVAVDLKAILKEPGSDKDIVLEDGDEILIPQIKNVVSVTGEVFKPVALQFRPGASFRYYVSSAGGFASKAKRNKSFVVYSNGRSRRTISPLGLLKFYPRLTPGSTIVVPQKPERQSKFDAAKAGILVSALSAIATTIAILKGL